MKNKPTIMIVASGTGGHIMPALAVANKFYALGYNIVWLGTPKGMEKNFIPQGFSYQALSIGQFRGKNIFHKLIMPIKLFVAIIKCATILLKYKPNLIFATGGYVCAPVGLLAKLFQIPLCLQEQNSKMGLTNRLLSRFAKKIFVAYPETYKKYDYKQYNTGNPVREIFLQSFAKQESNKFNILVLGGSQGALILNQVLPQAFVEMANDIPLSITHQCGIKHVETTKKHYENANFPHTIMPFMNEQELIQAYTNADLIICRAGALTVSEILCVAKPCIFVPYPHAADDHQYYNAKFYADNGAALVMPQQDFNITNIKQKISNLYQDKNLRATITNNMHNFKTPHALEQIVSHCTEVLNADR